MADAATRAEICAAAVADAFRGDGERLASCFGAIPAIGANRTGGSIWSGLDARFTA